MTKKNYFFQRDENNIYKLRDLLEAFPDFTKEFFVGVQTTTAVLTRLNYAYDLRIFFDYLINNKIDRRTIKEITLDDFATIKAYDIELYLEYLSSYTFNGKHCACGQHAKERKLSTLRSFYKYYFKKERLSDNPAIKVDLPKVNEKSIVRLECHEVAMLLDEIENENTAGLSRSLHQAKYLEHTKLRDLAIVTLFLGTGIRISELVGLDKSDMDFSSNSFKVTRKGGDQTILYFNDEIAMPIKAYLKSMKNAIDINTEFGAKIKNNPALFFSLQGGRISVRAVQNLVKKYAQLVAPLKKITPHKLRSTFGTELYRSTHDIYIVADILGHKDINTTKKHYAAISEDIKRNAAKSVILRDSDSRKSNPQNVFDNENNKNCDDSDD